MKIHFLLRLTFIFIFISSLPYFGVGYDTIYAQTVGASKEAVDLQQKIIDHNKQLDALDQEIKKYQTDLNQVSAEKQSLQSTLKTLDLSRKKVTTDIKVTETKIETTNYTIQQLANQISDQSSQISKDNTVLAQTIQTIDELESNSFIEIFLSHDTITDMWDDIESLNAIQESLQSKVQELTQAKEDYESARDMHTKKKDELAGLKEELSDKQKVLDVTHAEKDELLSVTKNKESNFQKILADKKKQREQFEKELLDYESQLKFVLDKSTIPVTGSGALKWPFEASYFATCANYASVLGNPDCVTQYFGNTTFAKSGAYNGQGHNGIDFRAPIGTKIVAALSGDVVGIGNTDTVPNCYSYGKWVLVRHNNGISTLYAHLSSISVANGAHLETGGVIGYSGTTGYVTGPHLHFGVFASTGVKIQKLGDIPGRPITGCSPASIPVAGLAAYLNPLDYLL